ncbi:hypothetical protein HY546_01120 [archaeon]|nr:hypothetical protein [archaeon]
MSTNIILKELEEQKRITRRDWAPFFYQKLLDIELKAGPSSFIGELKKRIKPQAESAAVFQIVKPILENSGKTFEEIKENLPYSKSWLRKELSGMEKRGLIASRRLGRKKEYFLKG